MACGEIGLLPFARTGAITHAIIRRAEERSALDHIARSIAHYRHFIGRRSFAVSRPIQIARQLPDIADHVEESVGVRRIATRRSKTGKTIIAAVHNGKDSLPGIRVLRLVVILGRLRIPGARRPLPLCLARQIAALPVRIGERIVVRDFDNRIVVAARDIASQSHRMAPIRAGHVAPPLRNVLHAVNFLGHDKNGRTGLEHIARQFRVRLRVDRPFGGRHIAGRRHKGCELGIGDLVPIHPEAADTDLRDRPFFGIDGVAFGKGSGGNPDHAAMWHWCVHRETLLRRRADMCASVCDPSTSCKQKHGGAERQRRNLVGPVHLRLAALFPAGPP